MEDERTGGGDAVMAAEQPVGQEESMDESKSKEKEGEREEASIRIDHVLVS